MRFKRYLRNVVLENIGDKGQEKICSTKILIIGAGGLGSFILPHLAMNGFSEIEIIDGDVVSITNLQRQLIYTESNVGMSKSLKAKEFVEKINSETKIKHISGYVNKENTYITSFENADIVICATDNYESKLITSEICKRIKKPLILGAITEYDGWTMFQPISKENDEMCFSFIFPDCSNIETYNCDDKGVNSVSVALVATHMMKLVMDAVLIKNTHFSFYNINAMNFEIIKII